MASAERGDVRGKNLPELPSESLKSATPCFLKNQIRPVIFLLAVPFQTSVSPYSNNEWSLLNLFFKTFNLPKSVFATTALVPDLLQYIIINDGKKNQ